MPVCFLTNSRECADSLFCAKVLLVNGATVKAADDYGQTALIMAAGYDPLRTLEMSL